MASTTKPLQELIDALTKLPGIGRKTAQRLAFHILKSSKEEAQRLANAILDVKEKIFFCSQCFNITDTDPCSICADPNRSDEIICVVEQASDMMAIETIGEFKGKYHILHGALSPLSGVGPENLKIKELIERVKKGRVKEVIIATNPDAEGSATALYLTKLLKPLNVKVTRIAEGVPSGGNLEYIDPATLRKSLEGRREV